MGKVYFIFLIIDLTEGDLFRWCTYPSTFLISITRMLLHIFLLAIVAVLCPGIDP